MIMKISTHNIPFIIIVFIITSIGVPLGIIWPSIKQIRSTSEMIYREYQYLEERYQRGKIIKQAHEEYVELRIHLPTLRMFAIEPNEELKFITALENLAEEHGVAEKIDLDIDNTKQVGGYKTIPLKLTISGSYRDIVKFMAGLKTLNATVSLQQVALVNSGSMEAPVIRGKNREPQTALEAQLTGFVYQHLSK